MQDLMQSYANDLNKLRDAFHNELTATAEELSKAMAFYTLVAVMRHWHHSWRKLRLVARSSKGRRRREGWNPSSAVFQQTALSRASMTNRPRR